MKLGCTVVRRWSPLAAWWSTLPRTVGDTGVPVSAWSSTLALFPFPYLAHGALLRQMGLSQGQLCPGSVFQG